MRTGKSYSQPVQSRIPTPLPWHKFGSDWAIIGQHGYGVIELTERWMEREEWKKRNPENVSWDWVSTKSTNIMWYPTFCPSKSSCMRRCSSSSRMRSPSKSYFANTASISASAWPRLGVQMRAIKRINTQEPSELPVASVSKRGLVRSLSYGN